MTHIVRHESQHVVIYQRRTGRYGKPPVDRAAVRFFHDMATRVIDEYRCEAAACRTNPTYRLRWRHVLSGLNTLGAGLDTAVQGYQRHRDVYRVRSDVAEAVAAFWVLLGYFAGARNAADKRFTLPAALAQHPLWARYAKGSWPAVEQLLSLAPRSDAERNGTEVRSLKRATRQMAAVLTTHLLHLGFEMVDEPAGGSSF